MLCYTTYGGLHGGLRIPQPPHAGGEDRHGPVRAGGHPPLPPAGIITIVIIIVIIIIIVVVVVVAPGIINVTIMMIMLIMCITILIYCYNACDYYACRY